MTAAQKKSAIPAIQAERKNHPHLRDDEPWRDFLESRTRKRSLREMTPAEQQTVLLALRPEGKPYHGKPRHSDTPQMRMIRGLWIELKDLGVLHDPSEAGLGKWIKRQSGQDIGRLESATASRLIEALKEWVRRAEAERGATRD